RCPHVYALISLLICFCLHSPGHPRVLPSFPTRRSSDLRGDLGGVPHALDGDVAADVGLPGVVVPVVEPGGRDDPGADRVDPHARSEEHTSELQSRENLVCRLLLEKKKNTTKRADDTTID